MITARNQRSAQAVQESELADDRGAQIVEFAVALPLLIVFVVGIFDFSGAFTLKQKLTNISRDAARLAAADPATDILKPNSTVPASVDDAYQAVLRYFTVNNLNKCGITEAPSAPAGPPMWTFSAPSTSAPCALTIIINRGYYLPAGTATQPAPATCQPTGGGGVQVVATCVSIQYSYQWQFGKVASLLGPGAMLPQNLTATSIAMNEN